eukprot:m.90364 g.90364  ORF g.90364 m.90364 type:complete len:191 (+) comp18160_c0_seq3:58-630(+)
MGSGASKKASDSSPGSQPKGEKEILAELEALAFATATTPEAVDHTAVEVAASALQRFPQSRDIGTAACNALLLLLQNPDLRPFAHSPAVVQSVVAVSRNDPDFSPQLLALLCFDDASRRDVHTALQHRVCGKFNDDIAAEAAFVLLQLIQSRAVPENLDEHTIAVLKNLEKTANKESKVKATGSRLWLQQ